MSIVDGMDIPVSEKVLRLQSSLIGKALTLVKDPGFSINAYERAKEKLEKKYGGERRLQIKHLTALRGWQKVRPRNLEDMENFQGILERVWMALKDCGSGQELQGHDLNLSKGKTFRGGCAGLQALAYRSFSGGQLRVTHRMGRDPSADHGRSKGRDEPEGRRKGFRSERVRSRTFNTKSKSRSCIVETCKQNHPLWVCKAFKELPFVLKRKELIRSAKRCYRCLAAGQHSKECPNTKRCGVNGCLSTHHSSYLHENTSHHLADRSQGQLHVGA